MLMMTDKDGYNDTTITANDNKKCSDRSMGSETSLGLIGKFHFQKKPRNTKIRGKTFLLCIIIQVILHKINQFKRF